MPDTGVKPTVSISPGVRIVFQSDRDIFKIGGGMPGVFSHQLWLMDPDGSSPTRLTNEELEDEAPA